MKEILEALGIYPHNENKPNLYLSPLTGEKTPSFNIDGNAFKCFSSGLGGGVADFLIAHFSLKDEIHTKKNGESYTYSAIAQALKKKDELLGNSTPQTPRERPQQEPKKPTNTVTKVIALENMALKRYLDSRGIKSPLALQYVKEIHYHNNKHNKNFYAVGMINESQGAVIRTKNFKSNIGKSDITVHSVIATCHQVKIFEGIFDFWSYIEMNNNVMYDAIILNSTTNVNKLKLDKYDIVELYLDNGTTGDIATIKIMEIYSNAKDMRKHYKQYDDLNDFVLKRKIQTPTARFIRIKDKIAMFYKKKLIREFTTLDEVEKYIAERKKKNTGA